MRFLAAPSFVAMAISLSAQNTPPTRVAPPPPLASGPEAGSDLTKVEVYAPTGSRAGTTFDAAAVLGQGPGALLFVSELTRNVAPMIRGLDQLAAEHGLLGFHAFTVLLADDRTAAEQQLGRSSPAMGLTNPMVLSVAGSDGPGSYGINRKCTLTLVLADKGKIVRSVGYTDTGPQDVPQVETWITELTGPMPRDIAGMRELLARRYANSDAELLDLTARLLVQARRQARNSARMNGETRMNGENGRRARPEPAPRDAAGASEPAKAHEGSAPQDPELRELLRAAIQRTATEADLDAVFRDIDTRVGADASLEQQAVEMFKLVLSLGYGTDAAQARCKIYLAAHAKTKREGK